MKVYSDSSYGGQPPACACPRADRSSNSSYLSADRQVGKGVAHDILCQHLLTGLVISGDAVPRINAEPAVVPVQELLDEIISYLAFAFQHVQNPGPENFLKLFHVGFNGIEKK